MNTDTDTNPPEIPGLTYERRLGRGGYAEVFLYEQANPRMRVAVKVLSGEGLTHQTRERFAAEANAMAELAGHPNIVQVFRADNTADGRPYLVMKYYPQRNMAVRSRMERLSVPEVLQIGIRIACAVETAHRVGILHRDIKPANILTSQYGEPGLTDFGIATTIGAEGCSDAEGMSVPWAPPEVLFGTSPGDRSADIYALGATLWHLLAGRSPFEEPSGDNTSLSLMRRIREQPPPRTGRDDVPASFERLLAQAMAKNPEDRPQSALQMARAMQGIEAEQRWAPTPLVLLEGAAAEDDSASWVLDNSAAGGSEPGSETRARTPQTVWPRPERKADPVGGDREVPTVRRTFVTTAPIVSAASLASNRERRTRRGLPGTPDEPRTVRRATAPAEKPDEVAPAPVAIRRRRSLAVAVGLVVAVAATIAIGLAQTGKSSSNSTSTTTLGSVPTIFVPEPLDPTVTAVWVGANRVRFSWREQDAQPGDSFWWQIEGSAKWNTKARNSVTLEVTKGSKLCIVVEVERDDFTLKADSLPKCVVG